MKKLIRVMKAVADPGRVNILKMLAAKEMCVCEIQAVLGLAQPTISKHLKILEDAGLVESRKDKVWVNYRLAAGSESEYAGVMLKNIKNWLNHSPETVNLLQRAAQAKRENICKLKL
ncbi:MAG: winged helix-turn-helix transcriptional regulator [Deltaproteobacteria bacterium]|nr:winged helix-turn-helix transcriptional regulator [Deltaproteobacteria bacterium]